MLRTCSECHANDSALILPIFFKNSCQIINQQFISFCYTIYICCIPSKYKWTLRLDARGPVLKILWHEKKFLMLSWIISSIHSNKQGNDILYYIHALYIYILATPKKGFEIKREKRNGLAINWFMTEVQIFLLGIWRRA